MMISLFPRMSCSLAMVGIVRAEGSARSDSWPSFFIDAGASGRREGRRNPSPLPSLRGFLGIAERPVKFERLPPSRHSCLLVGMANEAGLGRRFEPIGQMVLAGAAHLDVVRIMRTVAGGHGQKPAGFLELRPDLVDRVGDREIWDPSLLGESVRLVLDGMDIDFK